jgi:hemerythrin-like domain-containing protein
VEQQREKEREQARLIEELRGTIRQRDLEIERLVGKHDNASYFQRTLEQEMSQLRQDNQRLQEALNAAKTEEVRGEQRKNQYELEILDLRRTA